MRRRRRSRALLVLAFIILGLLSLPRPAGAGHQDETGRVRFGHLAPAPTTGDVYVVHVDGRVRVTDLPYGVTSDYLELDPGTHTVELRNARAPAGAASEHTAEVAVEPGSVKTVLLYGPHPDVMSLVMDDRLERPSAGAARVRAANVLPPGTRVAVADAGGTRLLHADPGTASGYTELPEGTHTLLLRDPQGNVLARAQDVTLRAGESHVLVATGERGGTELLPLLESAAAQVPTRIDTGAGGAALGAPGPLAALTAFAAATLLSGLLALRGRCTIGTIRWLESPRRQRP